MGEGGRRNYYHDTYPERSKLSLVAAYKVLTINFTCTKELKLLEEEIFWSDDYVSYLGRCSCDNGREPGQQDSGQKPHGEWVDEWVVTMTRNNKPERLQVIWKRDGLDPTPSTYVPLAGTYAWVLESTGNPADPALDDYYLLVPTQDTTDMPPPHVPWTN